MQVMLVVMACERVGGGSGPVLPLRRPARITTPPPPLFVSVPWKGSWVQDALSAPWSPRTSDTSVVRDTELWLLGGANTTGPLNDVWRTLDGRECPLSWLFMQLGPWPSATPPPPPRFVVHAGPRTVPVYESLFHRVCRTLWSVPPTSRCRGVVAGAAVAPFQAAVGQRCLPHPAARPAGGAGRRGH
jgi:hypothetical protein